ncbi:hypothetical protein L7F22_050783 [Adiantum nelumboides]|nr:hypothetical protein [Adiantum nelumboides]
MDIKAPQRFARNGHSRSYTLKIFCAPQRFAGKDRLLLGYPQWLPSTISQPGRPLGFLCSSLGLLMVPNGLEHRPKAQRGRMKGEFNALGSRTRREEYNVLMALVGRGRGGLEGGKSGNLRMSLGMANSIASQKFSRNGSDPKLLRRVQV